MKDAWKNWGRTVALWGLAGLAVGFVLSLPITGVYVDHPEHDGVDHNYNHRIPVSLIVYMFAVFARNKEGIEALSGVFVAGFTFTLWRATDKLWDATKAAVNVSERVLTDLERPHVYASVPNHVLLFAISPDPIRITPSISFMIKNYGRTPAIIYEIGAQLIIPTGDDILPVAQISPIILEQNQTNIRQVTYQWPFNAGLAGQITRNELAFWVIFEVRYRDIFGVTHVTSGTWKYHHLIDEFNADPNGEQDVHT
jgi:hypothetical protein